MLHADRSVKALGPWEKSVGRRANGVQPSASDEWRSWLMVMSSRVRARVWMAGISSTIQGFLRLGCASIRVVRGVRGSVRLVVRCWGVHNSYGNSEEVLLGSFPPPHIRACEST